MLRNIKLNSTGLIQQVNFSQQLKNLKHILKTFPPEAVFNKQKKFEMNEYEESRRIFLAKLGLAVGAPVLAGEKLSAQVLNNKTEFPLSPEQQQLMNRYERWMDEFIPVIKAFRTNPEDATAKKSIAELSEEAETWRIQLTKFMKDENFARYYMTATERMTKEIY